MDWHTGSNPWAPGGRMTAKSPWAQQGMLGMQHGWQQAGGFFTPKSDAQIRREGLMQLAILAAVVVAPALIGASGGGAAAGGAGGGATAGVAATTTAVESATGAAVVGAGGAASAGAASAALLPFTGAGALAGLLGAAAGGSAALNQALQQRAPAARMGFVFDPGVGSSAEAPTDATHPAMPLLEGLAGRIGKNRMLELNLRRALMTGNVMALAGQPALVSMVGEALRDIRPENPWAKGGSASQLGPMENPSSQNDPWPLELLDTGRKVDYLTKMEMDIILAYNKLRYDPIRYSEEYLQPLLQEYQEENKNGINDRLIANLVGAISDVRNAGYDENGNEKELPCLPILTPSKGISKAAQLHADELANSISEPTPSRNPHIGLDGSNSKVRISRWGSIEYYSYDDGSGEKLTKGASENIYFGSSDSGEDQVLKLIIDYGVPDGGHRENALKPFISRIGVGASTTNFIYPSITVHDFATEYSENP